MCGLFHYKNVTKDLESQTYRWHHRTQQNRVERQTEFVGESRAVTSRVDEQD